MAKTNITKHHMHVFIKCSTETLNCGLNNKLIVFYICNSAVSHHRPEPPTKQVLKIIHVTSGLNLGFLYYESSSLLYQGNIAIVTYTADLTSSRARSEITSSWPITSPENSVIISGGLFQFKLWCMKSGGSTMLKACKAFVFPWWPSLINNINISLWRDTPVGSWGEEYTIRLLFVY